VVKVRTCECCGHPLPNDEVELALPHVKRRIFQAVKRAGRRGASIDMIMDYVYGDDPSGGPESTNVLHVHRGKMQPTLAKFGLKLTVDRPGPGASWTLEKL
jgi:hypothetical protein